MEKEQSREEIETLLAEAFKKQLLCDLVIENSDGSSSSPDSLIEAIHGKDLMITYIAEDGDLGESIPVSSDRIKKITNKDPFNSLQA